MTAACGEALGSYTLLQVIGRGSFCEVFLAEDMRQPGHRVAIKTLPPPAVGHACCFPNVFSPDTARTALLSEGDLLRRLKHPHVVRCLDVAWDATGSSVWLALELMEGDSVRGLLDAPRKAAGEPFDARFVHQVLREVGSALCYIHALYVLHRDVKPANMLLKLQAPPVVKLADFGVSKLLEATGFAHTNVGTQYYLSPELVTNAPYGPPDAWALGVCMFELASLRRPFEANNPIALARAISSDALPPLPRDLPENVVHAIAGLLTKAPADRLQLSVALEVCADDAASQWYRGAALGQDDDDPASPDSVERISFEERGPSPLDMTSGISLEDVCGPPCMGQSPRERCAPGPILAFGEPAAGSGSPWQIGAPEDAADRERRMGGWWTSLTNRFRPGPSLRPAPRSRHGETVVSTFEVG